MKSAPQVRRVPTPCLGCGRTLVYNKYFCSDACMSRTPATPSVGLAILSRAAKLMPPPRVSYLELVR